MRTSGTLGSLAIIGTPEAPETLHIEPLIGLLQRNEHSLGTVHLSNVVFFGRGDTMLATKPAMTAVIQAIENLPGLASTCVSVPRLGCADNCQRLGAP